MKYFTVIVLAAICGSALSETAEWMEKKKQCAEKHNVSLELARNAVRGKTPEVDVTHDIKCYFLCVSEKQNIIKDGAFQPQVFTDVLSHHVADKELIAKVAAECNVKGTDNCDTGFKVASCIFKNHMRKHVIKV